MGVCLTNPTGRCQTRPAGYCPSGPGCGPGLAADQCGGLGLAGCRRGSLHLPSSGRGGNPAHRLLGRPCSLRLSSKNTHTQKKKGRKDQNGSGLHVKVIKANKKKTLTILPVGQRVSLSPYVQTHLSSLEKNEQELEAGLKIHNNQDW